MFSSYHAPVINPVINRPKPSNSAPGGEIRTPYKSGALPVELRQQATFLGFFLASPLQNAVIEQPRL